MLVGLILTTYNLAGLQSLAYEAAYGGYIVLISFQNYVSLERRRK